MGFGLWLRDIVSVRVRFRTIVSYRVKARVIELWNNRVG